MKKLVIISFFLVLNSSCTMEPDFKVYGEPEILKEIQINLEIHRPKKYPLHESKIITIFDRGKWHNHHIEYAHSYTIYAHNKNKEVATFWFENIEQWANDNIHHIYVYKKEDSVFINHVGRTLHIEEFKHRGGTPLLRWKDYLDKKKNKTKTEIQEIRQKIFNFYKENESTYTPHEKKLSE